MTVATVVIPAAGRNDPAALERLTGSAGGLSLLREAIATARAVPGVANVVLATDTAAAVNAAAGLATTWYQPTDDSWCGVLRAARALEMLPGSYSAAGDVVVVWEPDEAAITAEDLQLLIESTALFSREASQCAVCLTAPALQRDRDPRRRAVLVCETSDGALNFWPVSGDGPILRALAVYGFTPAGLRRAAGSTPSVDAIAARAEQLAWTETGMELVEIRLTHPRPVVRTPGDMRRFMKRRNGD